MMLTAYNPYKKKQKSFLLVGEKSEDVKGLVLLRLERLGAQLAKVRLLDDL